MPTLLLTRPEPAAQRFAALLRDRLGDVPTVIAPLIGIEIAADPPGVAADETYVLTSEHGVEAILRHDLPRRSAWAVGEATARAARAAGLSVRAAGGDADRLVDLILQAGAPGPLLHLRGEHARGDVVARLVAAGVPARDVVVYRQPEIALPQAALALTGPVVAPVFSPRTAQLLARSWTGNAPLFLVAMSAAVADELAGLGERSVIVAARPDARAMADAVVMLWQKAQSLEARAGGA